MKNIHVEKRRVIFPCCHFQCLPPSLALCPYANTSPPKSGKWERRFGSNLSDRVSSLKKVLPLLLRRKAQERRNIFSQHTQQGCFHFCFCESGIKVLGYSFCSLPSLLSCQAVLLSLIMTQKSPICYFVIGLQPALHHINKELSGIAHCQAQGLPWGGELRGHRGEFSAWWGARCSCRQMLRLGGQARGAIDKARTIGYWVGDGTAVADRATNASLTRWSHWALTWSSVAPDLSFAPTAARFPALVLAAVRTTASWRQRWRNNDYYPRVIFKYITFFLNKLNLRDLQEPLTPICVLVKWCRQYWPSLWETLRRTAWLMQIWSLSIHCLTQAWQFSHYWGQLHVFILLPQTACLLLRQILQIDEFKTIIVQTFWEEHELPSNPWTNEKIENIISLCVF